MPSVMAAVMFVQCFTCIAVSSMPSMSPMSSFRPAPNILRIGLPSVSVRSVASARSARSPLVLFLFAIF